jgi:putative transposase
MRFRLYPTPAQTLILERHCADARYIWNLALEQWNCWQSGSNRRSPTRREQERQLAELRQAFAWVAEGSSVVQQQALGDFHQAFRNFFGGSSRRPSWRRKGLSEGFRVVDARHVRPRRLNRSWGHVLVPKAGLVRFRMSRDLPASAKSYRITLKAGQWHIAFACPPAALEGPGDGSILGIDRGVTIPFACSDGTSYVLPKEDLVRHRRLQRHLARQKKGSGRSKRTKDRIAKIRAKDALCRKDVIEKATTDLAQRCDFFRIENLDVDAMSRSAKGTDAKPGTNVRQKAGWNRAIRASGWTLFATRLEDKAPYRVERVKAAFTSQRCAACGHVSPENRKSQAVFRCVSCGHTANADLNAAQNIAAGHAVTARGGWSHQGPPTNREPQPSGWNPLAEAGGGCQTETLRESTAAGCSDGRVGVAA